VGKRAAEGGGPAKTISPARGGKTSRGGSPLVDAGIWLIALIATGLTVWYSLGPRPPDHGSDWEWHAVAYFIDTLAILLAVVWRPGREARRFDAWALPVALAVLLVGGLIEIVQGRFADRDAQFRDWIADAAGIWLAVLLFTALRWAICRKPTQRLDDS
jgi:VanZ family protein